ncbi:MAG: hypothetical protein HYX75_08785 [Acidobacteria bacterium]|nr:hypothetical protein [Acidobacteriota bacterium]
MDRDSDPGARKADCDGIICVVDRAVVTERDRFENKISMTATGNMEIPRDTRAAGPAHRIGQ